MIGERNEFGKNLRNATQIKLGEVVNQFYFLFFSKKKKRIFSKYLCSVLTWVCCAQWKLNHKWLLYTFHLYRVPNVVLMPFTTRSLSAWQLPQTVCAHEQTHIAVMLRLFGVPSTCMSIFFPFHFDFMYTFSCGSSHGHVVRHAKQPSPNHTPFRRKLKTSLAHT